MALVLFFSFSRKKRCEERDLWGSLGAFAAAWQLVPAAALFAFGANPAKTKLLPEELHGFEFYICLAAICSFLLSCYGVWSITAQARRTS